MRESKNVQHDVALILTELYGGSIRRLMYSPRFYTILHDGAARIHYLTSYVYVYTYIHVYTYIYTVLRPLYIRALVPSLDVNLEKNGVNYNRPSLYKNCCTRARNKTTTTTTKCRRVVCHKICLRMHSLATLPYVRQCSTQSV